MQKLFVSLFILFLACERCPADDHAERCPSPDKQFTVIFPDSQSFAILDAHGASVLLSSDLPQFRDIAEFRPDHTLWSPDSQILALAGGGGHDLDTFIFVRHASSFVAVSVQHITGGYDNPYITPLKWLSGHRLILDISGPHAGKSPGYRYTGRATIRVFLASPGSRVLYKRITDHHYTDDA